MPERLATAVQQFADDVGRLHTPLAVLVALQNVSHCTLGLEVLGAWVMARHIKDQMTDWREGENLFFHPDVPPGFWPDYLKQYAEHGYSALTLKAWRTSVPFTFAEAEQDDSGSQASWIFDFFRRFDMRDGLYCTYRAWAVAFISTKLLALRLSQRCIPSSRRPGCHWPDRGYREVTPQRTPREEGRYVRPDRARVGNFAAARLFGL